MARCAISIWLFLLATAVSVGQEDGQAEGDTASRAPSVVVHLRLDDQPITPATVRFMRRGLREAADLRAECLVIELDTPGGTRADSLERFRSGSYGFP